MNMIYENETLYVGLTDDNEINMYEEIRDRIFDVLDIYKVDNIILDTRRYNNINKRKVHSIKRECTRKYGNYIKIV